MAFLCHSAAPDTRLRVFPCLLSFVLAGSFASAQEPYSMVYWDFGGDVFSHSTSSASTPTAPCTDNVIGSTACAERFSTVGAFSMGMGVRPIRYLQIDPLTISVLGDYNNWGSRTASFTCVSGCSSPTTAVETIGSLSGLVTTGARGVLPLFHERLLLSGGGGFAWLRTNEHAQSSGNEKLICESCQSVGGHGPSAVAEVMYMLNQHIGVGVHVRYVHIGSAGITSTGNISNRLYGTTYKDGFLLIGGEVSIRWITRHR